MPVYSASITDVEGRLDPTAFRSAFLYALQQYRHDVNAFLIPAARGGGGAAAAINSRVLQQPPPPRPCLEELSDEDDEDAPPGGAPGGALAEQPPRLRLVVDLDNTLVHAQSKYKLNLMEPELYDFRDAKGASELFRFVLPRQAGQAYFLKLRPGAVEFLRELSTLYDVAVHTNATQEYADVVLSILDPDRSVIGLRIAARFDEFGKDERKDMNRLFPGDREKLLRELVIFDDRRDVWDASFEANIVQCHYYEYFESRKEALARKYPSGSVAVFKPYVTGVNYPPQHNPWPVTLEPPAEADPEAEALLDDDRQLFFVKEVLKEVGAEWYALRAQGQSVALPDLLAARRKQILQGCVVLMTGYHKVEQASQFGMLDNGPQHKRRLEHMGAIVVEQAGPDVTHVVVMRQTVSTDRARNTCGKHTKFVHNLWIYACEHAWTKVDEALFEATAVLAQFAKPPTRPQFDHWRWTKRALTLQAEPGEPAEPAPGSRKRKLSTDGAPRKRRPGIVGAPDAPTLPPLPRYYGDNFWPAGGPYSDGAEVWSALEHVTLRYDSFFVEQIKQKQR